MPIRIIRFTTKSERRSDIAATRGISDIEYYSTEQQQVFSPELRKIWRSATKYQLGPETDLLRAVVAILADKTASCLSQALEKTWRIDYREPIPEEADPTKSYDILDKAIESGRITRLKPSCATTANA